MGQSVSASIGVLLEYKLQLNEVARFGTILWTVP